MGVIYPIGTGAISPIVVIYPMGAILRMITVLGAYLKHLLRRQLLPLLLLLLLLLWRLCSRCATLSSSVRSAHDGTLRNGLPF